jgi:Uncharacterised nucleotidyltransferase
VDDPRDVTTTLRKIASSGLHDETIIVPSEQWKNLLSLLKLHRLSGIAVAAHETGQLELASEQLGELLEYHRSVMVNTLYIEQRMLHLHDAFMAAGIREVVLKGPSVAHTVYPDPAMRPFGDLDLLVSTADWKAACRTLLASGFTRDLPEPRRGFDERFGKAATHSDGSGLQVDLHRTLVVGPFGLWLEPEVLMEFSETFALGCRAVRRLDRTGLLLNAALHAGLGNSPPLLLPLRDVAELAKHPDVDWERFAQWVAGWRLIAAIRHAFACASLELGCDLSTETHRLAGTRQRRWERRVMSAYTHQRASGGVAVAATRAIPGLRAKAAYVFALLLPSREFIHARAGKTETSYLSRWRIPLRWMASRVGKRRTNEMR